jgi:hypothetical protein
LKNVRATTDLRTASIATNSLQALESSHEKVAHGRAFRRYFLPNAAVAVQGSCHVRRKYRARQPFPTASSGPVIKIRYRLKASGKFITHKPTDEPLSMMDDDVAGEPSMWLVMVIHNGCSEIDIVAPSGMDGLLMQCLLASYRNTYSGLLETLSLS